MLPSGIFYGKVSCCIQAGFYDTIHDTEKECSGFITGGLK